MTKQNLSLLCISTGLCISLYAFFSTTPKVISIGDTYMVIDPKKFSLLIFGFYGVLALLYFIIRKHCKFSVGFGNLVLISVPIIYYIATSNVGNHVAPTASEVLSATYKWRTVYFRQLMLALFFIGTLLFIVNLAIAINRLAKAKRFNK